MPDKVTWQLRTLLKIMLENEWNEKPSYGFDLADQTGLATGTIYGLLMSMERDGWASKKKEDGDAATLGRRPRTMYLLTERGRQRAKVVLDGDEWTLRPALGGA